MDYPRKCPGCGTLTPEEGFHRDLSQPSGRKSRCQSCHRRAVKTYHDAVRKPRRQAVREAERAAEWKTLEAEHRERAKAVKRAAAAGAKRQREFLASIGVPDLTPEEIMERARRRAQERL
jgi:acyl-CoA reductase-like NAD-dependent aldehyde dehydrogenase